MPPDKPENFDIAKLDPEANHFRGKVEQNYVYDLSDKKAGGFDVFTWNLFVILQKLNMQKGLKGPIVWIKANREAQKMINYLAEIEIDSPVESERFEEFNVLKLLKDLSSAKSIKKLVLTPKLDLLIIGQDEKVLYKFNLIAVKRDRTIQLSKTEREEFSAEDIEKWITGVVEDSEELLDKYFGFLGDKKFEELKPPAISESRAQQTVTGVSGLRAGREVPKVISDELRNLDLCSSYVIELLEQAYGKEVVRAAGFIKFSKYADAWDVKTQGLKSGFLEVAASTLEALVVKKEGVRIKNKNLYFQKLGDLFRAVDKGPYPTILTAFQTNTKYFDKITAANRNKQDDEKNYNSHILVVLGREDEKSLTVEKKCYLGGFLKKLLKIPESLQCYLKLRVKKVDGSVFTINDDGKTAILTGADGGQETQNIKLATFKLEKGDQVFWQDVLVSDFYKGEERIIGMVEMAAKKEVILMENLRFNSSVQPKSHPDYKPIGFMQVEAGKDLSQQFKEKLRYSDADLAYYLAALADIGVNLNAIQPKDLLPVFDLQKLMETVDKKGGPAGLRNSIVADNVKTYNENHPEAKLIIIESGSTPWTLIKDFFESHFQGKHTLTGRERAMIVEAVDQSCVEIDLTTQPLKFEAGTRMYLSNQRIAEIVNYIYEKQAEQFSENDYAKIIERGDDPIKFLAECYKQEVAVLLQKYPALPREFVGLDPLEKDFLLKAFKDCNKNNPEIDLNLEARGDKQVWKKFPVGARIVMARIDMEFCVREIGRKRFFQLPNENFYGPETSGLENVRMGPRTLKLPFIIKHLIHRAFPGKTLEDTIVRNALYFVYAKEQLGGGRRAFAKDVKNMFGPTKSRGTFQLRATRQDMVLCKDKFKEMGLQMPEDFDAFKNLIVDDTLAATIVAGERLRESYRAFRHFMRSNEEDSTRFMNQHFAVMLVTSYNRSAATVFRAVFQNWAYNLAEKAGVRTFVELKDIDALARPGLENAVVSTFKRVVNKLKNEGKIKFDGDVDAELGKIFENRFAFLRSPLFKEIQRWYKQETGAALEFTFSSKELGRGNGIFSYGQKYLPEFGIRASGGKDDEFFWARAFKDYERLKDVVGMMRGDYQLPDYEKSQRTVVPKRIEVPVTPEKPKEAAPHGDLLVESGIKDCLEPGTNILTVLASKVFLRAAPNGQRTDGLYFGNKLEVREVRKIGGEYWAKVKVVAGPDAGKEGYIGFDKQLYGIDYSPKLHPSLQEKLELAAKDSRRPLPKDYILNMRKYLRFIDNLNPKETPHSTDLMAKSNPTAFEVQDAVAREKIFKIAILHGYKGEKFFGIILKNATAGLLGQRLFVIDKERNRILAFMVSTGRPGHETPAGKYLAVSNGFRDVNYFGSHQGTFARKYRRYRRMTSVAGGPGSGPLSMTTALIDTQLYGSRRKSTGIYFHGTNHEHHLGAKASHGCIRMSNLDVVYLASVLNGTNMDFQIIERVDERKLEGVRVARAEGSGGGADEHP